MKQYRLSAYILTHFFLGAFKLKSFIAVFSAHTNIEAKQLYS